MTLPPSPAPTAAGLRPFAHAAARRWAGRLAAPWLLVTLAAAALPAQATPDGGSAPVERPAAARAAAADPAPGAGDAILQLLHERGLLSHAAVVEAYPAVRQVRDAASDLVISAMNFVGVRYRRGGNSIDEGFDCSGFTRHVFETSLGLVLPRRAEQQATLAGLLEVARDQLQPGDLVFFNTMRRAFSHVGIYVGEGKFIHAPRAGASVRIEDMRASYWAGRFNGARRAEPAAADLTVAAPAASPRR